MSDKLALVSVDAIMPHPLESEIYGEIKVGDEFVASIRDQGVLQPLLLADSEILNGAAEAPSFIVSGHRRWHGAIKAGLAVVPAIYPKYDNYDQTALHLIVSNMNREKSGAQRRAEFLQLKQKLSQLGKLRQKKGIYADTIIEDSEFLRLLKYHKFDDEAALDSIELLKEMTGFTEWQQRLIKVVFDDEYRGTAFNRLYEIGKNVGVSADNMNKTMIGELDDFWEATMREADKGNVSLKSAHDAIRKAIAKCENRLRPTKKSKKEKSKIERKKPTKKTPEFDIDSALEDLMEGFDEASAKYLELKKFGIVSKTEYGYVFNKNDKTRTPVGVYVQTDEGVKKLNMSVICRIIENL